ncbi:caspase family protein [Lentzea alba]|uniref:caspase, EACC1-associated type n=1 Tax=Lentzea alba TaxID=2714351 RepID=UPI0039BF612B
MARRIALLIATDTYADGEFPNLRTPCTDAAALASLLGDPAIGAFEVTTLQNRPAQEIRQVLDETFTDAHRDDLVLLHVSGHGIKDEAGRLHLVMSDTRRKLLRASAIAATWVRELIDHSAARRVVVWLDCCFSGAFPPGFTPKAAETVDAIDQLTGRGCAVMTASTRIQYAFEHGQMSLFTQAIVEGLRHGEADLNKDGRVDVSELYSYVFDWVRERTPDQTPTRNDMLTGDIYIAYSRNNTLPEPPPAPVVNKPLPFPAFEHICSARAFTKLWGALTEPYITGMAIDPSSPRYVCISRNSVLDYLNVEDGRKVRMPVRGTSGDHIHAVAFSPDGQLLAIATDAISEVWFLEPEPERAIITSTGARAVAFSPDGTLFATGDSTIHVWAMTTRRKVGTIFTAGHVPLRTIAISPDNRLLASGGSRDRTAQLWDRRNGTLIRELQDHDGEVRSVRFSPDGRLIATAGFGGAVHLWDVVSGRLVRKLFGHRQTVSSLAFSPDGRVLVSGSVDRTVRVWNPSDVEPAAVLTEGTDAVVAVDFNPAGDTLAAACSDGQVLFWQRV